MLKQYAALIEAERILSRLQYEVWKETHGRAWKILVHAREYVRQQQKKLFAESQEEES